MRGEHRAAAPGSFAPHDDGPRTPARPHARDGRCRRGPVDPPHRLAGRATERRELDAAALCRARRESAPEQGGALEPLNAIADLRVRERLRHYVDGAYGAFFHRGAERRAPLLGLSRADSLTLHPHKGMFLPRQEFQSPARGIRRGMRVAGRGTRGILRGPKPGLRRRPRPTMQQYLIDYGRLRQERDDAHGGVVDAARLANGLPCRGGSITSTRLEGDDGRAPSPCRGSGRRWRCGSWPIATRSGLLGRWTGCSGSAESGRRWPRS